MNSPYMPELPEIHLRFRNRWSDCKSGNVSSGNTIAAQQCWSDVRVERQPGEAISPQVIVLPHDKRYVAPLSGNCIAVSEHKAICNCRLKKENK